MNELSSLSYAELGRVEGGRHSSGHGHWVYQCSWSWGHHGSHRHCYWHWMPH
jgi:hypothetical protein